MTDTDDNENTKGGDTKEQTKEKGKGYQPKCRVCINCKATCETLGRNEKEWCKPCVKKKSGGKSGKTACRKRPECDKKKQERDDPSENDISKVAKNKETDKPDTNDKSGEENKRKQEFTPPMKTPKQRKQDEWEEVTNIK